MIPTKNTKIIAISSFPCLGNAGLKPMMSILSKYIIPVPSLILSGTTNLSGIIKTETDFTILLEGCLELCKTKGYEVILFCGYYYKAFQIDFTLDMYNKYKNIIKMVIVDPIMGDDNKLYVEKDILENMPKLISIANVAIPNVTELQLLSGSSEDINQQMYNIVNSYPQLTLIVKSIIEKKGRIGIKMLSCKSSFEYQHRLINIKYGGTGDLFISYLIKYYIFKKYYIPKSIKKAAQSTLKIIKKSKASGLPELIAEL